MNRVCRMLGGAAAAALGFCVPAIADLITIDLATSIDTMTFVKDGKQIKLVFDGGSGTFPAVTGKATSVKQVAGKADQKDSANYTLRYLEGLKITLTHGKGQDMDTWTVDQTGGARFIEFCYATNLNGHCTRLPNPPALLDSHFTLSTFKQDRTEKDGKAVFNFSTASNLLFFNKVDPPKKDVSGKILEGSPQFIPPGVITLTVNLGKGFDLNSVIATGKDKTVPLASGQARIYDKKPAGPDNKAEMKAPAKSGGNSVFYDAASASIAFRDDRITDTGDSSDPVINALVNLPDLFLAGARDDIYVFIATDDDAFDISHDLSSYVNARLPVLFYDATHNSFFGELSEFAFASLGSQWVNALSELFDATSAGFDPKQKFWFTYTPDRNLLDLTSGFKIDGFSGGTNLLFVAPEAVVPIPSVLLLVAGGLLGWRTLRRRSSCSNNKEELAPSTE
jgi:hypothetical protein